MFLLKQATHRMLLQYDPNIGCRFVPNQKARLTHEAGGYFVATNSSGFRSDCEFDEQKHDRPRILMFGDSYTAGDNVSNQDRYSDILAQLLGCEVYNYGISGTGTDQHLLAYRQCGRSVARDAVVLCVQIDSFHRIQQTHRPSIDRTTGRAIEVPKPYFTLSNNELTLNHVPVPLARPEQADSSHTQVGKRADGLLEKIHGMYLRFPGLKQLRESALLSDASSRLITEFRRLRGCHSYPDLESTDSPGWQLMSAILKKFIAEVQADGPTPVVIFPIPTRDFYLVGMEPTYQRMFQSFDSPANGVHVGDVSTPLAHLPYEDRLKLSFQQGGHFTPMAHRLVAESMQQFLCERGVMRANPATSDAAKSPAASKAANRRITRPEPVGAGYHASGPSETVLGVSCFYHNSAAALLRDGQIVAAVEEERFSRVKNDRRFPMQSINFCLEQAGINQDQLAAVAFYDDSALTFERIMHSLLAIDDNSARRMWDIMIPEWVQTKLHFPALVRKWLHYDGLVLQGNHHRSHAASCFYPSPFDRAAILTIDGVGEWATASIGHGRGNQLELIREMVFPHSLGLLYSAFTHFTGFKVNSGEYKMMGLAPYGRPIYKQAILDNIVNLKEDGSLELNLEYFSFLHDVSTTSPKFDKLFGGPRRNPDSRITRREMDLARSVQEVAEEALIRMARHAREVTGEKNLCLAGGVALNCVANGKLLKEQVFENLWIQPAAGDSGCALGVALDVWHSYFEKPRTVPSELSAQGGSYLGPEFSPNEIKAFLETHGYPYQELDGTERQKFLSKQLAEGKVVGHFAGRLEFGPRSLGARSILGDVRNTEMQSNLNLRIKYRESFRPFAPAVLLERVADYFEMDQESPYMLLVAPVKAERRLPVAFQPGSEDEDLLPIVRQLRSDIPAVTHVDYSARIQTVRREHHATFYELIRQFERDTGVGVVVNTSFNVRGEPIVCTPYDAYRCFMRTEMDVLALGNCILVKGNQPSWPEGRGEGLENEDVVAVKQPAPVTRNTRQLSKLFDTHFLPAAQKARDAGVVLIDASPKPSSKPSAWRQVVTSQHEPKEFEFGSAQLNDLSTPEEYAAAIVSRWSDQRAAHILEPVVAKALRVAMKQVAEQAEEAAISESVYVMF